uniref:Hsp90 co-chaperone Cdc37 n=1 Tax=Hucho hucho TaxID=62062 RepID=A0A4W5LAQ3_9TELE
MSLPSFISPPPSLHCSNLPLHLPPPFLSSPPSLPPRRVWRNRWPSRRKERSWRGTWRSVRDVWKRKTALSKAQAEEKKYRKDQRLWEKKMEEHRREEKKMPWNVDTLSKEGFSKSVLNIKPEVTEETEEQKEEKHQTFVEKHKKQIKHFGEFQHHTHTTKPF